MPDAPQPECVPLAAFMEITRTEFIASFPNERLCPKDGRPEFAFIGRSNVGKSSLINMLAGKKGLAKVSGTPGKTRLLNYFLINHTWYLVDLPGYGYARVSKSEHRKLGLLIDEYLQRRLTLQVAFVLIDANVPPMKIDLEFLHGLGEKGIPFALVFTKSDRLGQATLDKNVAAFLTEMARDWESLPPHFVTSSERRTGREALLTYIGDILTSAKTVHGDS